MNKLDFAHTVSGLTSTLRQRKLDALDAVAECGIFDNASAESDCETDKLVARLITDSSESVRQKALEAYALFVKFDYNVDGSLPVLLNMLQIQLADTEVKEDSEEIRLLEIKLLTQICEKKGRAMGVYVDEILKILQQSLKDSFGEIRISSCTCLKILASSHPCEFFPRSDVVIDVLLATFTHSQAKVRAANTEAIGFALQYGNYKRIGDVWRSLAQRVIDSSHLVRLTVFGVLHLWMTKFPDRYSHWTRFIPLFICGLFDEITDIRTETARLWKEIGDQYEAENRDEIKEEALLESVDFHYPKSLERPSLGCRMLVKIVVFGVMQSTLNDLRDWQENVRIQAIKLLYQLMLHVENHIVILIDKILLALPGAAKDESQIIVTKTQECAELIGCFVEPMVYCKLFVPKMEEAGHLVVLSGILQTAPVDLLADHLTMILSNLRRVTFTKLEAQHFYSLECCERLLNRCSSKLDSFRHDVYGTVMQVRCLTTQESLKVKADECLSAICAHEGWNTIKEMNTDLARRFCTELLEQSGNSVDWSGSSMEYQIFHTFMLLTGMDVFVRNFDLYKEAIVKNLQPTKNVKTRFIIYKLLLELAQGQTSLLKDRSVGDELAMAMFIPNMTWKSGRSESVLRSTCCSCLAVLLEKSFFHKTALISAKADFLPKLIGLSKDERQDTLRATARLLRLFIKFSVVVTPEEIKQIYPVFLRGLDAEHAVRLESLAGLGELLTLPAKTDDMDGLKVHIEEVCRILLIHTGDSDKKIAEKCFQIFNLAAMILQSCTKPNNSKQHEGPYHEMLKHLEAKKQKKSST